MITDQALMMQLIIIGRGKNLYVTQNQMHQSRKTRKLANNLITKTCVDVLRLVSLQIISFPFVLQNKYQSYHKHSQISSTFAYTIFNKAFSVMRITYLA